uniref:ATP synthase F0 subunit 8 n=1 Tax=Argiope bruennichi TaxID=94029 RepID=A0A7L7S5P1_ARGBR|nr:ATP synthase F0 subunit 8 [Argiope bruennichi]
MPQLMPLNWVFSSVMISLVVVSACVIYSEKMEIFIVKDSGRKISNKMDMWFW